MHTLEQATAHNWQMQCKTPLPSNDSTELQTPGSIFAILYSLFLDIVAFYLHGYMP